MGLKTTLALRTIPAPLKDVCRVLFVGPYLVFVLSSIFFHHDHPWKEQLHVCLLVEVHCQDSRISIVQESPPCLPATDPILSIYREREGKRFSPTVWRFSIELSARDQSTQLRAGASCEPCSAVARGTSTKSTQLGVPAESEHPESSDANFRTSWRVK